MRILYVLDVRMGVVVLATKLVFLYTSFFKLNL